MDSPLTNARSNVVTKTKCKGELEFIGIYNRTMTQSVSHAAGGRFGAYYWRSLLFSPLLPP